MNSSVSASISTARLEANRRNASLSTGPVSADGKARSSHNALKTGLTGRTVLLPTEDAALYESHTRAFLDEFKPVGDRETELVQSIADTSWRLARIPALEFGIYALGRIQFADEFANVPPQEAAALIEARTFLAFQRQLKNLSIQESRLRRQSDKDVAELNRLQQLRVAAEREASSKVAVTAPAPAVSEANGFEFPTPREAVAVASFTGPADHVAVPQAA